MDGMDELKQIFFTESAELMADMEERLLKLDEGTQDKEQLNAIFRCAHSIKGGSGAFGLDKIMHFTHTMEALLDGMRDSKIAVTREAIDLLLKSVDIVNQLLAFAQEGKAVPDNFGGEVVAALQQATQGGGAPVVAAVPVAVKSEAAPVQDKKSKGDGYDISFVPHAGLFASGNEPLLVLRELSKLGETSIVCDTSRIPSLAEIDPEKCYLGWNIALKGDMRQEFVAEVFEFVQDSCDLKITKHESAPAPQVAAAPAAPVAAPSAPVAAPAAAAKPAAEAGAKASASTTTSIRVDLDKIDRLVNMVGELVITEAMIRAQARNLSLDEFSDMQRGLDELSQHTRELQEAVMAVRMQPVKSIFSRMPRIVRDTAAALGKDIQLVLSGENTEVDKTVIEQLSDPLTHMIRNSCDHGIETPDQRVWNDKPVQGTIHLSAGQRSGRIIIEISDDGAGINRDRVLNKAIEKGLVAADAQLPPEEIDQLIFAAGFSTAEKVTSVSGRGVGMDVVRRNIEGLGGTVRITNNPGKGSIFTVSLPLTLAILDGMIVRVGGESYIVPIANIIETMRPTKESVHVVEGHGDVINVRGEFVPLLHLDRIFGVANAEQDISKALVVLVESANQKMGLLVDELVGQQQVVIKSLEANADPVKGVSGATILGDGKVSLILEINDLKALSASSPGPVLKTAKAA